MTARICLNMIVKDESAILERALVAVTPHIDCYVIADTGSTDDTVDIVKRVFDEHGVPGEIVHTEFANFEQARNVALDAARASSLSYDYLLLCDADMELVVDDPHWREQLTAAAYLLLQRHRDSATAYRNLRLVRREVDAHYRGVTHEYLDLGDQQAVAFDAVHFEDHAAGASRTVKYERDIALLRAALDAEPDNPRSVFYLAQSYRDSDDLAEADRLYQRRAQLGGWDEEVWYSLYQSAVLAERLRRPDDVVVHRYLAAYQYRPQRAEPLVALARYHRENGARYALAKLFATQALAIPRPDDLLFLDEATYAWRARDEYAVAAYWTGAYQDSADTAAALLAENVVPPDQLARVRANLEYALAKLPAHG